MGGESVKRSLLDTIFNDRIFEKRKLKVGSKKKEEWLTRLYKSEAEPTKPVLRTSIGVFTTHLIIPLIIGGPVYVFLKYVLGYAPMSALAPGALLGILALAAQLATNTFIPAFRTLSIPPIASPEQFDAILSEILTTVLSSQDSRPHWLRMSLEVNPSKGRGPQRQNAGQINASSEDEQVETRPGEERPSAPSAAEGLQTEPSKDGALDYVPHRRPERQANPRPRAIILIDELDRCSSESRREVLQGLRTYLRNDRCVYVVACAPGSLRMASGSEATDELPDEEFLRKLFSLTCWIDSPGEINLARYAERCMEEVGLKTQRSEILLLLELANTSNPRRVKHFLNTLNMAFRLARAREDKGQIARTAVTGYIPFLAKVILIRQEWPDLFGEIFREPRKLGEYQERPDTYTILDGTPPGTVAYEKREEALTRFLHRTSLISAPDPAPFFSVTAGMTDSRARPVASLENALEINDIGMIKRYVEGMEKHYEWWSTILFDKLRRDRRNLHEQFLVNDIVAACALLEFVPNDLRRDYVKRLAILFPEGGASGLLPYTGQYVLPGALLMERRDALPIIRKYFGDLFNSGNLNEEIGSELEKNAERFQQWAVEELNDQLTAKIAELQARKPSDLALVSVFKEWPRDGAVIPKLINHLVPEILLRLFGPLGPALKELTAVLVRLAPAWAGHEDVAAKVRALAFEPVVESSGPAPSDDERKLQLLDFLRELAEAQLVDGDVVTSRIRTYFSGLAKVVTDGDPPDESSPSAGWPPEKVIRAVVSVALSVAEAADSQADGLGEPSEDLETILNTCYRRSAKSLPPLATSLQDSALALAARNLSIYILWVIRTDDYQVDDFCYLAEALFITNYLPRSRSLPDVREALRLFTSRHPDKLEIADRTLEELVGLAQPDRQAEAASLLLDALIGAKSDQKLERYRRFPKAAMKAFGSAYFLGGQSLPMPPIRSLRALLQMSGPDARSELSSLYVDELQANSAKIEGSSHSLALIPELWSDLNQDNQVAVLRLLGQMEVARNRVVLNNLELVWPKLHDEIKEEQVIRLASNLILQGRDNRSEVAAYEMAARRLLRGRVEDETALVTRLMTDGFPLAEVEPNIRRALDDFSENSKSS